MYDSRDRRRRHRQAELARSQEPPDQEQEQATAAYLRDQADALDADLTDGRIDEHLGADGMVSLARDLRDQADALDPRPRWWLWIHMGSRWPQCDRVWERAGGYATRTEALDAADLSGDWPAHCYPVLWAALPDGETPGPDTRPDARLDLTGDGEGGDDGD
jgi:hypothetical protein